MKLNHTLFLCYITIWIYLAIDPSYRDDWLLENIMVFIAIPIILLSDKRVHFSPITHFFGFERNHYDRLLHFLFGFLLFPPFHELFSSRKLSKHTATTVAFLFLIAASGVYEVIEWIAAEMTHPQLGTAFLGTQGDQWDAQKDMALGYLGTILAFVFWHGRKVDNVPHNPMQ